MEEALLNDVLSILNDVLLLAEKQNKLLADVYELLKEGSEEIV